MHNMKVLHVAETIKGGVATVLQQLSYSEADCYFLIPHSQGSSFEVASSKKIDFKDKGRGLGSIVALALRSIRVVKQLRPNVIHLHSSFSLILAPLLCLISRSSKIVYQPHGVFYDPDVPRPAWKIQIIKSVEKLLVFFVDQVISISEYEENLLIRMHGSEKVKLLKNSALPSLVTFDSEKPRSDYLFVGRLDEQKGIDELLKFWENNGAGMLHVIGDSVRSDFTRPKLKNVTFHGWVESDQLDEYYSSAEAVLVPSRWEGFGLVVIEAFRNGTPVIASNRGALPELIDANETGFIFSLEEIDIELRAALNSFDNIEDKGGMRKACYERYTKKFNIESYLENYQILIQEMVNVSGNS